MLISYNLSAKMATLFTFRVAIFAERFITLYLFAQINTFQF